jgi:hypothetical protein
VFADAACVGPSDERLMGGQGADGPHTGPSDAGAPDLGVDASTPEDSSVDGLQSDVAPGDEPIPDANTVDAPADVVDEAVAACQALPDASACTQCCDSIGPDGGGIAAQFLERVQGCLCSVGNPAGPCSLACAGTVCAPGGGAFPDDACKMCVEQAIRPGAPCAAALAPCLADPACAAFTACAIGCPPASP